MVHLVHLLHLVIHQLIIMVILIHLLCYQLMFHQLIGGIQKTMIGVNNLIMDNEVVCKDYGSPFQFAQAIIGLVVV